MKVESGHMVVVACGMFVVAGGALLTISDLAVVGWYCIGAGLVGAVGTSLLVRRLGSDVSPSPLAGPPSLPEPGAARDRCPACGASQLQIMTAGEAQEFYGYDRFVLLMPRRCMTCAHEFEVDPGKLGCYFLTGFSVIGALFGLFLVAMGPCLVYAMFFSPRPMNAGPSVTLGAAVVPVIGAIIAWRFAKETLRHWKLSNVE